MPSARTRRIPLIALVPRRDRSSTLARRGRAALRRHLAATGLYPPLIVRRHPSRPGRFEILDGAGRAEVLAELGAADARCEVWAVSDEQADLLAVSLNHLRGRPDVRARARQVRRLVRKLGPDAAAEALAMTARALGQQLDVLRRPRAARPDRPLDLRPVVFHLTAPQTQLLRETLRRFDGPGRGRGDALAEALRQAGRAG